MKNYINSRIEGFNNLKIRGMYEHDLRTKESRHQKNNKTNFCYDVETNEIIKVRYISLKDQEQLSEDDLKTFNDDRKKLLNYYHKSLDKYSKDREEHNNLYKKRRNQNLKDSTGSHAEGILTFSEQIQHDFNNGKLDLNLFMKRGIAAAKESCKYLGAELINVTLHLDETTPHFHYIFKNFDENGKSLTHKANIKNKGLKLEYLQDIATKHFEKDFGIKRGIEKEFRGDIRHQTTTQYYEKKIYDLNLKVKEHIKILENTNKQQKEAYTLLNKTKSQLKETQKEFDSNSEKFQELSISIKDIQQKEKQMRFEYKQTKKEVNEIKLDLEENKKTNEEMVQAIEDKVKEFNQIQYNLRNEMLDMMKSESNIFGNLDLSNENFHEKLENYIDKFAAMTLENHKLKTNNRQLQEWGEYREKVPQMYKTIEDQAKTIKDKKNDIKDLESDLEAKDKEIEAKENEIEAKDKEILNLRLKYEPECIDYEELLENKNKKKKINGIK